jgi:hypothetical protein
LKLATSPEALKLKQIMAKIAVKIVESDKELGNELLSDLKIWEEGAKDVKNEQNCTDLEDYLTKRHNDLGLQYVLPLHHRLFSLVTSLDLLYDLNYCATLTLELIKVQTTHCSAGDAVLY